MTTTFIEADVIGLQRIYFCDKRKAVCFEFENMENIAAAERELLLCMDGIEKYMGVPKQAKDKSLVRGFTALQTDTWNRPLQSAQEVFNRLKCRMVGNLYRTIPVPIVHIHPKDFKKSKKSNFDLKTTKQPRLGG